MVEASYQISDVLAQLTAVFFILLLFLYPISKFIYIKSTKDKNIETTYETRKPSLITGVSNADKKIIFGIFIIAALITCFRLA